MYNGNNNVILTQRSRELNLLYDRKSLEDLISTYVLGGVGKLTEKLREDFAFDAILYVNHTHMESNYRWVLHYLRRIERTETIKIR